MTVNWIRTEIDDQSGKRGSDMDGNRYFSPPSGETVYCTTPDGRKGCGWTPAQALESALPEPADSELKIYIGPETFKSDVNYIRMTPLERQDHVLKVYGANLPADLASDEAVTGMFKSLGKDGELRIKYAETIMAPPDLGIGDLSYWYERATVLCHEPVTILQDLE